MIIFEDYWKENPGNAGVSDPYCGKPPDISDFIITPDGPRTEEIEGEEHQRAFVPRAEAHDKAWLPWKSNGCERGLKTHGVNPDGSIREIMETTATSRQKPKAISSRQWERWC